MLEWMNDWEKGLCERNEKNLKIYCLKTKQQTNCFTKFIHFGCIYIYNNREKIKIQFSAAGFLK